jgi:hypothetical protein
MGFAPFLVPYGRPELKRAIEGLLSLNDAELEAFRQGLGRITAPINRRAFRKVAQSLTSSITRVPERDLAEAVGIVCQVVRDEEILVGIEEIASVPKADRERLEALLHTFKGNKLLTKAIALDRFLDRGPRIQHLSWVCDVRMWFPDGQGGVEGSLDRKDEEDFRIALAIFRLKVDDWDSPIYFQVEENELESLISDLQKARTQLQRISQGGR